MGEEEEKPMRCFREKQMKASFNRRDVGWGVDRLISRFGTPFQNLDQPRHQLKPPSNSCEVALCWSRVIPNMG